MRAQCQYRRLEEARIAAAGAATRVCRDVMRETEGGPPQTMEEAARTSLISVQRRDAMSRRLLAARVVGLSSTATREAQRAAAEPFGETIPIDDEMRRMELQDGLPPPRGLLRLIRDRVGALFGRRGGSDGSPRDGAGAEARSPSQAGSESPRRSGIPTRDEIDQVMLSPHVSAGLLAGVRVE